MVKILLAISILVTALTAGLGFMTKGRVDGLKQTLTTAQSSERAAKEDATKARGDLKRSQDELTAANKAAEDAKAEAAKAEATLTEAKSEADKAKGDVAASAERIAKLEKELAEKGPVVDKTPDVSPQLVLLQGQLATLQKELEEQKQVADTLRARETESTTKLADAQKLVQQYRQPIDRAGLTGRIVAVNPGWNFVVLDVGDRRGATVNSPLLVTRGGQVVARLKITSVEPNSSIADVLPGSLPRGESIQPGDRVVFAGRQAPAPAPTPADAAPAPTGAAAEGTAAVR